MIAETLTWLFEATAVTTLALLAVLLLRGAWLRAFGARNALLLWLVVPLALAALFLPAPVQHIDPAAGHAIVRPTVSAEPLLPAARERLVATVPGWRVGEAVGNQGVDPARALFLAWLAGALLMAALLAVSQWRAVRALGPLTARPDGSFRSSIRDAGPLLIGALRPRIVLPADFAQRYTPAQQELVIEHERCHLWRGDAQCALLASILRCLFWFNPLIHFAWPRFRMDQELACDAVVLRRHPQRRREYAEALLVTQADARELAAGCAWRTGHPLTARIRGIAARPVGSLRALLGSLLVIVSGTTAVLASWAHQEPQRFFLAADGPSLAIDIVPLEPSPRVDDRSRRVAMVASRMPAEAISLRPPAVAPAAVEAVEAVEAVPATAPHSLAESLVSMTPQTEPPTSVATNAAVQTEADMVDVEHAQLLAAERPAFPESRFQPRLVRYPGMPASEQPGQDWRPEGSLWVLLLRASLDEQGRATAAVVEDTNLANEQLVSRYRQWAMESLQEWRFSPARIDGDPVRSEVLLPFYFDTQRPVAPIDANRVGPAPTIRPIAPGGLIRAVNR